MRWKPNVRFVALALIAVMGVAALKLMAAALLTAYSEVALRIEQSQALLNRYRALSGQRSQLSARLQTVKDAVAVNVRFFKAGPNDTLAGAAFQNHVRKVVEGAGGLLRSSQILPAQPVEPEIAAKRVGLRLDVRIGVENLQDMLYNLETARPSIFIQEITILTEGTLGQDDPTGENRPLAVNLEAYGLMEWRWTKLTSQLDMSKEFLRYING